MAVGADTVVVNGQRFTTPTTNAYDPLGFGPQTSAVPTAYVSVPPVMGGGGGVGSGAFPEGVGGYGTAGNNNLATQVAGANPWGLRESPVIWAIGLLLLSLFLLRAVHWRKTTLAGVDEGAHLGGAHESAEASV
ncbi:MAG: hypothetical protein M0Z88_04055 [Actinomycetota bacterium]|nr:hypothetical protein [Actinomycetota bacterium]